RRTVAADAMGGRCVSGRIDGDRRAAATERVRVGVAGAAVASARRPPPSPGCSARGRGGTCRPRDDRGPRAAVLCEGRRPRSARSAAASRVREAVDPPMGMRAGMVALAAMCIALGLVPGLVVPTLTGLAPGVHGTVLARHAGLVL